LPKTNKSLIKLLKIYIEKTAKEIYTKYMLRCQRVVYTNGIESYSIAYLSLSHAAAEFKENSIVYLDCIRKGTAFVCHFDRTMAGV
jgi:hypothetical protein